MTPEQFNDIYWAAQPPEVRALREVQASESEPLAKKLAVRGFVIDGPIHGWKWDAYRTMWFRQEYGLANILAVGGQPIKTSLNAADYPAFDPPKVPEGSPVGEWQLDNLYRPSALDSAAIADGSKWTDSRGTFVKHIKPVYPPNPFNPNAFSILWEKLG